jgi:tetratricopeptide (TPR) repeat protein
VDYQTAGSTNWVMARTNLLLNIQDRVRTHELSEVVIQLADFSILRIGELSLIEIVPAREYSAKFRLSIKQGLLYFFYRNDRSEIELETPTANAAIEGTEFNLVVLPDGATELTVVEGRVVLSNALGEVRLSSGETGVTESGQAPQKTAALDLVNVTQWSLYYPGVVAPGDLGLTPKAEQELVQPLEAYRQGDLLAALKSSPAGYQGATAAERLFKASLLLAAGRTTNYEQLVQGPDRGHPLATALNFVVAAARNQVIPNPPAATNASQLLGWSCYLQSRNDLAGALAAAKRAVRLAPDFGYGWERVAELEFSHGRVRAADRALAQALKLSPRNPQAHALRGFVYLSRSHNEKALASFEAAVALDPMLANGWLGRGLSLIALGRVESGRADIQAAVAAEPNRWILRCYLAKAYSAQADATCDPKARRTFLEKARVELDLAKSHAPNDPTPWLYSALLANQQYRINEALRDLERSIELNDNRQVYRSRLLLDQDQAVRRANLAQIYELAGMPDVARRESARAVMFDYANYSAHYNLASSFFNLRDPTRFHLRNETEWFNEHLLASLLAPTGAGSLSQNLSQDEYARLFRPKPFGLSTSTEYFGTGEWRELATQFGTLDGLSYALDLDYQAKAGIRPNNDLSRLEWYSRFKQNLTAQDSVLLLTKYEQYDSGDQFQYFDSHTARPNFRFREEQLPWLMAGYHREWAPGVHTLVLAGRLMNEQWFRDVGATQTVAVVFPVSDPFTAPFDVIYHNESEIYSAELNQIFEHGQHTDIVGLRGQGGTILADSRLDNVVPSTLAPIFQTPVDSALDGEFERVSLYAYHYWKPRSNLLLGGGVAYDWIDWPRNYRRPPLSADQVSHDWISPKAVSVWSPADLVTLRGIYARSVGGISYDDSVRLEPTQLAGFSQSYRTLIPETLLGSIEAPRFDIAGGAIDLKIKPGTCLTFDGQWKRSQVERGFGYFSFDSFRLPPAPPAVPTQAMELLDYQENSARVLLDQVLADNLSLETGYQFTRSTLERGLPDLPASATYAREIRQQADLHEVVGALVFNHPNGLFARSETRWFYQANSPDVGDSNFAMLNFFVGYRFPRHRAELTLGLLNAADVQYRLLALNYYQELPRERSVYLRLKLNL